MTYKGYLVEEIDGSYVGSVKDIDIPEINDGNVLIKVNYSSLNYKDALASSGAKGVVKSYPFVPGIDVAGEVIESKSSKFSEGDKVLATGYKIGMSEFGGFGEIVHLPDNWIIKMPKNLSSYDAMTYGTAGLTAAASVKKITDLCNFNSGPALVSGATGGVGSISVGILSKLGVEVHAITGKPDESEVLSEMGAMKIIPRNDFMSEPVKALDKGIYNSAVDTVGGNILAKIISLINNHGVVSCCGNVAGASFESSVFPFILRGIQLCGIDSAESPLDLKESLWELLSDKWSLNLTNQTKTVKITEIDKEIGKILKGEQVGRIVIEHEV